jgi:hypothetical protein
MGDGAQWWKKGGGKMDFDSGQFGFVQAEVGFFLVGPGRNPHRDGFVSAVHGRVGVLKNVQAVPGQVKRLIPEGLDQFIQSRIITRQWVNADLVVQLINFLS